MVFFIDGRHGTYKVEKTIGKGSYGKVKIGEYLLTGQLVAVKILNRLKIGNMLENVNTEINIGMQLNHEHVIKVYDFGVTAEDVYIIMEYAAGGELFDYVVAKGKLQENEARHIFQQIIAGVEHCHDHMVVHRDLKLENLILDSQGKVKIADFGLSKIVAGENVLLRTTCGSPNYAAPELLSLAGEEISYSGPGADVWSCGVILYALLTGVFPFDDQNIANLFRKIKNGEYTIPKHFSLEARDLIARILMVNPTNRITIPEIRQHPWF